MDRTYWRAQDSIRLIDAARHSGHELCIAIGERLEDRTADFDALLDAAVSRAIDAERDADNIDEELDDLKMDNAGLTQLIVELRAEIKHLKETAK